MLKDYLFNNLHDYRSYINDHPFHKLINIDVDILEQIDSKSKYEPLGQYNKKQIEFCLGVDWISA